jgi:predicted RNase H-like nuclease
VLAGFDAALALIRQWQATAKMCVVAIDQPTLVPNPSGCRPVERVVGAVVSYCGGGVQPANQSKADMFGPSAPLWRFKSELGGQEDPSVIRRSSTGVHLIEVFPALALATLEERFFGRGCAPKYNPANRKRFRSDHWKAVSAVASTYGTANHISGLPQWAQYQASLTPSKADQDCLDAVLCAIAAHHWIRKPPNASVMVGDLSHGYIVTPASPAVRALLEAKAAAIGVPLH